MYRIKKIYPGENWDARRISPLTEPGLNVPEGSYLLAVNGHPPVSYTHLDVYKRQVQHSNSAKKQSRQAVRIAAALGKF